MPRFGSFNIQQWITGGFVRFEGLMNRYRMGPFEDVVTSEQELMAISGCEEDDVVQAQPDWVLRKR